MLRTVCDRVAFQETSTDLVRVSLDMQLHMVRELDAPHAPGDWCRDDRLLPFTETAPLLYLSFY